MTTEPRNLGITLKRLANETALLGDAWNEQAGSYSPDYVLLSEIAEGIEKTAQSLKQLFDEKAAKQAEADAVFRRNVEDLKETAKRQMGVLGWAPSAPAGPVPRAAP